MKQIFTLLLIAASLHTLPVQAQNYVITSSRTWTNNNSNAYPNSCVNCTFVISSGATLTINADVALQNCTFTGGNVLINNNNISLQTSGGKTYFTNTKVTVTGSGRITGSAPVIITNATFKFYNTSVFNPQQQLDITSSQLYFYDNSDFTTTGGPVNLMSNSSLVAGDGTKTSKAYLLFNGPTLNIYDNSTVVLGNDNNYYFNWSPYNSKTNNQSYNTTNNKLNCDAGHSNACSAPYLYGPATVSASGAKAITTLPVVLTEFATTVQSNNTVLLTWATQQESNSAYFSIERSADGANWTTLATVAAKGSSSVVTRYSYTDARPLSNANYYRMKMVDLDNTFQYSKITSVRMATDGNLSIYPNPATSNLNISLPLTVANSVTLRLFTTTGQMVQERIVTKGAGSTVTIPVQQFTSGAYMLQVTDTNGFRQNSMIVINK